MDFGNIQALMQTPLGQVVEKTSQVFWVYTADLSQILYLGTNAPQIWGLSQENLYQSPQSLLQFIHPDDREQVQKGWQNLLADQAFEQEYRIILPDQTIRWIRDRGYGIVDPNTQEKYFAGLAEDISDRKAIELALSESEHKFQLFANNADIVFWVCEPDVSKFHYISPGYEKIWGRSCQEIYADSRSFLESVHPDDLAEVIQAAVGENACHMNKDYRIIRADGAVRWINDRTFPVYDANGNIYRMVGLAEDITERKQAEQTISEIQIERLTHQIIQAIRTSLDLNTIFNIAVNEIGQLLNIDHVKISEFVSEEKGWLTVAEYRSHPQIPESIGTYIPDRGNPGTAILKQLEVFRIDDTNKCEDEVTKQIAAKFPGAWLIIPLHYDSVVWGSLCLLIDGRPRHWQDTEIELMQNIAGQISIAVQQSKLYQRTRYQVQREQVFNQVIQAIHNTLDLPTIFHTAVREIAQFLQVDRAEIAQYLPSEDTWLMVADYSLRPESPSSLGLKISGFGNPISDQLKQSQIVRIADTRVLTDEINKAIAEIFSGAWLLVPITISQGTQVWGSITLSIEGVTHEWSQEEVELTSAIIRQLAIAIEKSHLHQQVKQLAEAEVHKALQRERELSEAKSQFIANTSHEIRTPLATIQSSLDILQYYGDKLTAEKKQAHFQKIETAIKRTTQIVQDTLLISEVEANALQVKRIDTNIIQLCQTIVDEITSDRDEKQRIQIVSNTENISAFIDPKLTQHILTNLLQNALKYSEKDTTIQLLISTDSKSITFVVSNQGMGIPPHNLPHIFDSFYRADNVGNIGGTGLGLAIVKQCVDLQDGHITVESKVGENTTFTVTLPKV